MEEIFKKLKVERRRIGLWSQIQYLQPLQLESKKLLYLIHLYYKLRCSFFLMQILGSSNVPIYLNRPRNLSPGSRLLYSFTSTKMYICCFSIVNCIDTFHKSLFLSLYAKFTQLTYPLLADGLTTVSIEYLLKN